MMKKIIKYVSILAISLFALGMTARAEEIDLKAPYVDNEQTIYSYIWFGSYPQSEVTDETTISKIDAILTGDSTGDCWIKNDDNTYTKYRKIDKSWVAWESSTYWPNNKKRYFRYESIKWRVLSVDTQNRKLFIMADKALDSKVYHEEEYESGITWEESTIRSFLNGYDSTFNKLNKDFSGNSKSFFNSAFSLSEKKSILDTKLDNVSSFDVPTYGNVGGNNTVDNVFLLSYEDVENTGYFPTVSDLCLNNTDYAKHLADIDSVPAQWWLRSAGGFATMAKAFSILEDGRMDTSSSTVNSSFCSIVPTIVIDLDSPYYSLTEEAAMNFNGEGGIEYELYGGINDPENPDFFKRDERTEIKAPSKEGYEFAGWYTSSDYAQDSKITNFPGAGNVKLYAKWNRTSYVWLGSFPQSELDDVKDATIIKKIDEKLAGRCGDCWIGNTKYRKADISYCNNKSGWGTNTYRYFKWERIKWRVLETDEPNGKLLIMADLGLDSKSFNDEEAASTWRTSAIRNYLNNDTDEDSFVNAAFSNAEQKAILSNLSVTPAYTINGENKAGSVSTTDKIFLLSYNEAYNACYGLANDEDRMMKATAYSVATGTKEKTDGNVTWWLRSSGDIPVKAAAITDNGKVCTNSYQDNSDYTVVPAMYINLASDVYIKAFAEGSGTGGDDSYSITYETKGGVLAGTAEAFYRKGYGIEALTTPTKAGYSFEGWFFDAALTKKATSISNDSEGDVTLYAKWCEKKAANTISAADKITKYAKASKQTVSLGASANGALLSYTSSDKKVAVSAGGKVTIPAKFIGSVIITITAKENDRYLAATKKVVLDVGLAKVKKLAIKNPKEGQLKITWTADKLADGYEIRYATNNKFKSAKTIKVKKGTTKAYTLEKNLVKKTVFFKIRSYKKVGKKTCYSDYSAVKKVTVKK